MGWFLLKSGFCDVYPSDYHPPWCLETSDLDGKAPVTVTSCWRLEKTRFEGTENSFSLISNWSQLLCPPAHPSLWFLHFSGDRLLSIPLEVPELTAEGVNNSGHVTMTSHPQSHNASGGTNLMVLIPYMHLRWSGEAKFLFLLEFGCERFPDLASGKSLLPSNKAPVTVTSCW